MTKEILSYVKPLLLCLIPFLNGIGIILKTALTTEHPNKVQAKIRKALKDTCNIPIWLIGFGIFFATIFGLIVSTHTGWRYFVDAIVCTGIVQGLIVALISMGAYDTCKS